MCHEIYSERKESKGQIEFLHGSASDSSVAMASNNGHQFLFFGSTMLGSINFVTMVWVVLK
jgi:hypothetical protein